MVERLRRHLTGDNLCPICKDGEETARHLFWDCQFAKEVWRFTWAPINFGLWPHMPLIEWLEINCSGKVGVGGAQTWSMVFAFTLWGIWNARNGFVFVGTTLNPRNTAWMASNRAKEYRDVMSRREGRLVCSDWIGWARPEENWLKLNTDGASKRPSNMASAGGVLRDHDGRWVWGFSTNIGIANSFTAELWGLREGLRLCREKGLDRVLFELDSKGVVELMSGDVGCTEGLATLVLDCRFLLSCFSQARLCHTPREGNKCADYMANLGQSGNWGTTFWENPPVGVLDLLRADEGGATFRRIR